MVQVTVWVPDDLDEARRALLPHVKLSVLVQDAIRARLGCEHLELACRLCSYPVDRAELIAEALGDFYRQALAALEPLVWQVGTAEGAARILRKVARRRGVPGVEHLPLPRPARSQLAAANADKHARHAGRQRRVLPPIVLDEEEHIA
ncbi:MAG TPA: hypothetical protein VGX21_13210 [Methylomirabilota bacterium]|nr:hypothetical protein [Methylomirabilota bacterium]